MRMYFVKYNNWDWGVGILLHNKRKTNQIFWKIHPKIYPTHQLRFILDQYYQINIISYDYLIVFSNWFWHLIAYLEYSQE